MKIRMKFSKAGNLKFIGHLDVMRYFQKAFRRARLDMIYSQGYSPHPLLSFASPLGVGLTSDGEYLDIQLNTCDSSAEMISRINEVMAEDIRITSVKLLPDDSKASMALVSGADYLASLKDGYAMVDNFESSFMEFLSQESIPYTKPTKNGETTLDLKPWIYAVSFTAEEFFQNTGKDVTETVADSYENGQKIYFRLSAGSVVNIKPEMVLDAFYSWKGLDQEPFSWQIHRIDMYTTVDSRLVSLDSLGVCI